MQGKDGLAEIPTGISLEYKLSLPRGNTGGNVRLAVCLHPWSWLGGRMSDPVLSSVKAVFQDQGYHVLRYNSRGVGQSTGRASFTGIDEGKDLEAIIQWAIGELGNVDSVVIVGYSHGSLIATLHPPKLGSSLPSNQPKARLAFVLISYPLGPRSFLTLFKGAFYDQKLQDLTSDDQTKVLVAFGGRDEFTSFERYNSWVEQLRSAQNHLKVTRDSPHAAEDGVPAGDTLTVVSVPDASHFWHDESDDELRTKLGQWLETL